MAARAPAGRPRRRRWPWVAGGLLLALAAAFAVCEARGWPFLAEPARRFLSQRLQREVLFDDAGRNTFSLKLLQGPSLRVGRLQIANAPDIDLGPMLVAEGILLRTAWTDLLAWRPSQRVHLRTLTADSLALQLQRRNDGVASWQFGEPPPRDAPPRPAPRLDEVVQIDELSLVQGSLRLIDEPLQLDIQGMFSDGGPDSAQGLRASAQGTFRRLPLTAGLAAASAPRWLSSDAGAPAVPLALDLRVGRSELRFAGAVRRPLGRREVQGRFHVAGPSLAAVGEPLRLTLPQTRHFVVDGLMAQAGTQWKAVVEKATVGQSRLDGAFVFDLPPNTQPTLSGRLHASNLLMQDLGPAVGGATETLPKPVRGTGRVLPDRSFDLPSLRAMDANVLLDFDRFDFGTAQLQAASPLRAHLVLQGGQLGIEDLQAGLAQGRLTGHVRLDGREAVARWNVDLRGNGLVVQQWVRALNREGKPAYLSGVLGGRVALTGQGRSTAQLLGSADGRVQLFLARGAVSHLAVELAGLDLAQALGVALKGDEVLRVNCGAADLAVSKGRMTPQVFLVDTDDSTLWVDGSLSLADEQLGLVARVQPKDWSPLSLRTPVHIDGAWSNPQLSLEKGPLLQRVVPAALLAMLNPLAALLPLMDLGKDAPGDARCQESLARHRQPPPEAPRRAAEPRRSAAQGR